MLLCGWTDLRLRLLLGAALIMRRVCDQHCCAGFGVALRWQSAGGEAGTQPHVVNVETAQGRTRWLLMEERRESRRFTEVKL